MATNEQIIKDHLDELISEAEELRVDAETYLAELEALSQQSLSITEPLKSFTYSTTSKSNDNTDVTADFGSGLGYPDPDTVMLNAFANGYDSDFLDYLEAQATANPTATWVSTINTVRQTYRDATTTSAQNFVATIIPSLGNNALTHATPMTGVVNDKQTIHDVDFDLVRRAVANDLYNDYEEKARTVGINIEEVRARILSEMVELHSGYNQAVLEKARVDFNALIDTVGRIRDTYSARIQRHSLSARQNYEVTALLQAENNLELDKDLTELGDEIRRAHVSFKLSLGKTTAIVAYLKEALASAQLGGGSFAIYTDTSES